MQHCAKNTLWTIYSHTLLYIFHFLSLFPITMFILTFFDILGFSYFNLNYVKMMYICQTLSAHLSILFDLFAHLLLYLSIYLLVYLTFFISFYHLFHLSIHPFSHIICLSALPSPLLITSPVSSTHLPSYHLRYIFAIYMN